MLLNYFKVAWRNLLRNKLFSVIKILGLSIGLSACMLIFLYTKDEMTFDRFHQNKENLCRITSTWKSPSQPTNTWSATSPFLGEYFASEIPEVNGYVGVTSWRHVTVKNGNDVFTELPVFADTNFFSAFTFPLLSGNKNTALKNPHSMVLSRDMAKKYFGTLDALGKTLQIRVFTGDKFENYTVTAVAENPPPNSTFKVNIVLPLDPFEKAQAGQNWSGGDVNTFLALSARANIQNIEKKMQALFEIKVKDELAKMKQQFGQTWQINLGLQPLTDIHWNTKIGSGNGADSISPLYSYVLSCISIFILIIACINFINLAIAQSLKRSKEIGIRKVTGGTRGQLIQQFLLESFLMSLLAFAAAVLITNAILPFFNRLASKNLSFSYLADGYMYAGFFLLLLFTSLTAGFYPSLVLSRFRPVKVLYNRDKLTAKNYFTKGLIILQFSLAIFLVIGAVVINAQLNFVLRADRGFDNKNIVHVWLPWPGSDGTAARFKSELQSDPNVSSVVAANTGMAGSTLQFEGKELIAEECKIDEAYFNTFKIRFLSGRNLFPNDVSDGLQSVIVNESFVKQAGWDVHSALGKAIKNTRYPDRRPVTIIGVIKDFNFYSLHDKISPQMFSRDTGFSYCRIFVKAKPGRIPQCLQSIQSAYKKILPDYTYSYQFLEDINVESFTSETQWKRIINIASLLFVFISCIGLLGLVMLSIEHRTKEIGIRKVLGAAVSRIVALISRDFIILISISFVIAAPVGYYFANKWLQNFVYRINLAWWMFATAGVLVLIVALLTMSIQAFKAATSNPVKSLKTE